VLFFLNILDLDLTKSYNKIYFIALDIDFCTFKETKVTVKKFE